MKLNIFTDNPVHLAELREVVAEKLNLAFACLDTRMSSIQIRLSEMGRLRPGLTKHCELVITRPGLKDIVIQSSAGKTRKAVAQAICRAASALRTPEPKLTREAGQELLVDR